MNGEREEPRSPRGGTAWSFSIGSLLGVPIRVHLTFFLLLLWIGSLSAGSGEGFLRGVVFLLLLFGCVVLHELGHATVARRFGVSTRDIVLYPIGGVARLDRIPAGRAELWIALAGPAVSLLLAAMLWGGIALVGLRLPTTTDELVAKGEIPWQLAFANLWLFLFNLIPAFPMDGGRVLRASLSLWLGQERATRIAARVGQGAALLLAIYALLSTPTKPTLLLIALFVFLGAGQEAAYESGRAAVRGLTARSAMVTRFDVLKPDDSVGRATDLLLATHQHDFPVVDAWGRVAGILHRAVLLEALAAGGRETPVLEVMEREVTAISPETPLEEVLDLFQARPTLPLLVVGPERLEGMISLENFGELIAVARSLGANSARRARA